MNGKVREGAKREKVPGSGGSRKGKPNKITVELKTMVLQALDGAGGVEYLIERAEDPRTASAFLTLLGKVLPMQVTGAGGGPLQTVARIELVALQPKE